MNKKKWFRIVRTLPVPAAALLLSLFTSCESSRTAPVIPITTPVTPPSALFLSGDVKDADNNSAISGAIVTISKMDGSGVVTTATDNNGKYQYDLTNLDANQLKVSATKSSYGMATVLADINKTQYTAVVGVISLKKIVGVSTTATAASGGTTSAPSTESKSSTPATVNVPPGAVNQNTTVTVAPVPLNQAPPKATGQAPSLTVLNLEPSGITFNVPVTVVFPLPTKLAAGKVLPLRVHNATTGQWDNSGFNATVAADGLTASGQVTHFSTWEVEDPQVTDSQLSDVSSAGTNVTNFSIVTENGKKVIKLTANTTFSSQIVQGTTDDGFSDSFMKNQMSNKYYVTFGSVPITIGAEQPALPQQYQKTTGGVTVQYNPTTGSTSGKWAWNPQIQMTTRTLTVQFTNGIGKQNGIAVQQKYTKTGDLWTWIEHNQGGG